MRDPLEGGIAAASSLPSPPLHANIGDVGGSAAAALAAALVGLRSSPPDTEAKVEAAAGGVVE